MSDACTACIRLATAADATALAEIYAPAVVGSAISFEATPPDAEAMARRVASVVSRTPWLVYERHGEVHGYAYAGTHRERAAYQWSVEVSAYVRREMHRTGIARALYDALFAILRMQGFRNASAGITLPNAASVGLHLAMGFTPVGVYHRIGHKCGAWHDVGWYERSLAPHDASPTPPVPLPSLIETPAHRDMLRVLVTT